MIVSNYPPPFFKFYPARFAYIVCISVIYLDLEFLLSTIYMTVQKDDKLQKGIKIKKHVILVQ